MKFFLGLLLCSIVPSIHYAEDGQSSPVVYSYEYNLRGGARFGMGFNQFNEPGDPFSSGVSSYQGTTTGPGPNSGYSATPHGVYETNYYNPYSSPRAYAVRKVPQ